MRQYLEGDISKINVQEEQLLENKDQWWRFNHRDTMVFNDNEKVLAIVRPLYLKNKKICLTAIVSKDSGYKAISIVREMKNIIDEWLYFGEAKSVEFTTQKDFKQANRLAELLGFKKVGVLKKYCNGIDFNIWRRVI